MARDPWNLAYICAKCFQIDLVNSFKKRAIDFWIILPLQETFYYSKFSAFWLISWNIRGGHIQRKIQLNASRNLRYYSPFSLKHQSLVNVKLKDSKYLFLIFNFLDRMLAARSLSFASLQTDFSFNECRVIFSRDANLP